MISLNTNITTRTFWLGVVETFSSAQLVEMIDFSSSSVIRGVEAVCKFHAVMINRSSKRVVSLTAFLMSRAPLCALLMLISE